MKYIVLILLLVLILIACRRIVAASDSIIIMWSAARKRCPIHSLCIKFNFPSTITQVPDFQKFVYYYY